MTHVDILVSIAVDSLTDDLLSPAWKTESGSEHHPTYGHCYATSEALYHLLGGKNEGWVPMVLNHTRWPEGLAPGRTHWFLKNKDTGEIVDATEDQFNIPVDHWKGIGSGFLTAHPSRRAATLIERIERTLRNRPSPTVPTP